MTAHTHDPAPHADNARPGRATAGPAPTAARPRWLVPGLGIGLIVAVLLVAGVVSMSTVLSAGVFGGMILMHVGGHGGHGGHGDDGGGVRSDSRDLGDASEEPRVARSGSEGDGTVTNERRNETDDDHKHSSRGCH